MVAHWKKLERLLDAPLTKVRAKTDLNGLIKEWGALPNWRQRWCTRILKIEPCLHFIRAHSPAVLYVGLRADEPQREGIYGSDVETRFPLRDWGWGIGQVIDYLRKREVTIPLRTDCARCFGQRIIEWKRLWRNHPETFAEAEEQERQTGATFRSPSRDTWPAALSGLRQEFERGRKIRGEDEDDDAEGACRVCQF